MNDEQPTGSFFISDELKNRIDITTLEILSLGEDHDRISMDSNIIIQVCSDNDAYYYEVLNLDLCNEIVIVKGLANALVLLSTKRLIYGASLIVEGKVIDNFKIQLLSMDKVNSREYNYKFKIINISEDCVQ